MSGQGKAWERELPEAVQRLGGGDAAYLSPHHLEAAAWLARLLNRANLRQRVTMSYDPGRVGRNRGSIQADMSDTAADARKRLTDLARRLPPDCWDMLVEVCLHDRGLQEIETTRRWPRRAAKLVLRIGLDQVAALRGLEESARGGDRAHLQTWLPERLPMFGPTDD